MCHAGRLPMSMTSPAYGQEVTEASHTALMRNRLLQQMQAPSDADLHHLGSRYSPTTSQAAPKQRCDSRCLQPPLRGSGHHHYLPSAGEHHDCGCLAWLQHVRLTLHTTSQPGPVQVTYHQPTWPSTGYIPPANLAQYRLHTRLGDSALA